jgi:hypothetical protein
MRDEPIHGEQANDEADNPADNQTGGEVPGDARKFRLDWTFFAEHPLAIILMLIGSLPVAAITEFPGGNHTKVYWVAVGIWLLVGVPIWFVAYSIASHLEGREILTRREAEKAEQEYREGIQSQFTQLEGKLSAQGPRSLLPNEHDAIRQVAAKFPGQKSRVQAMMNDPEAAQYAHDFVSAFREAGWKSETDHMWVGLDFYNAQIGIAKDSPASVVEAATALQKVLLDLGLSRDTEPVTKVGQGNLIGDGIVNVRIGPKPIKRPPLREQTPAKASD